MDYISKPEKPNALIKELGLDKKKALSDSSNNHCIQHVPKSQQTYEMVKQSVRFNGMALQYAAKRLLDDEIYRIAVSSNGRALYYIPEEEKTKQLCQVAVENNGISLAYVPKKYITKSLCNIAVGNNALALEYVPEKFISKELRKKAVTLNGMALQYIPKSYRSKEMSLTAFESNIHSIKFIPKKWITQSMVETVLSYQTNKYSSEYLIKYIPEEFLNKEMVYLYVKNNPCSVKDIPELYYEQEIFEFALSEDNNVFYYIPENYITKDMCLKMICNISDSDNHTRKVIDKIPFMFLNQRDVIDAIIEKVGIENAWEAIVYKNGNDEDDCLSDENEKYITDKFDEKINQYKKIDKIEMLEVETPLDETTSIIGYDENNGFLHELNSYTEKDKKIYYISDIHIEHQMQEMSEEDRSDYDKVDDFLNNKITEMISFSDDKYGILLVGGDVGHTPRLVRMFYELLSKQWKGRVISVLGNHELWNGNTDMNIPEGERLSADETVSLYKEYLKCVFLLHNEVLILYKGNQYKIIQEEQILTATDEDLHGVFEDCLLIILGGTGFSGYNEYYNAERGLYRSTVKTLEEDRKLSRRFNRVYEKISRTARDYCVIVLTHNPVTDWTNETYNPKWIYINGHTHRNTIIREEEGTTVLSDNQIGYKPSKWKLNGFTVAGWYDPFRETEDGIHKINSEMYTEFNNGRGISSNGCNYTGTIYMIKRNKIYMFLLETDYSLCILSGGQRKRLLIDNLQYYYDNLEIYYNKVKQALTPYNNAIKAVASEVKLFGGDGYVHGCIVDIDYFNHLYFNPYDGKITPYWAYNISHKITYPNIKALLKERLPKLVDNLNRMEKSGYLPLLKNYISSRKVKDETNLAKVPKLVLDTSIYEPSRIMRAIQYIFDNNVVRVWNDEILKLDDGIPELPVTDDDYFYCKANTDHLERSLAQLERYTEDKNEE